MNVWWCNQGEMWDEERRAGVVRGSVETPSPTFRNTIAEVRAGDLVVHYRKPHVIAFSRAKEDGRFSDDLPEGYGSGWEFRTDYHDLDELVHRDDFSYEIVVSGVRGFAFDRRRYVRQGYFFRFSAEGLAVLLAHLSPTERLPAWLSDNATPEPPPVEEQDTRMKEGARYTTHLRRERNRRLAEEAKRIHGHICKVCDFDFKAFYGPVGAGYIEAHHIVPFHTLPDDAEVTLSPKDDFTVVCANCHRMLHRDPYPTVAELRATVAKRRRS
jgi:hypothetical protein